MLVHLWVAGEAGVFVLVELGPELVDVDELFVSVAVFVAAVFVVAALLVDAFAACTTRVA
jgi:uncharacterized membrane protein